MIPVEKYHHSLQPYDTTLIPAPKDVFLQFCVLTCCICYFYTSYGSPYKCFWLRVEMGQKKADIYKVSVCIHYTKVKIMSKKHAYF